MVRGHESLALPSQACQRRLENLEADLGGVFVRRETRHQLLIRVDVVSEVAQSVTELLDVELQNADLARDVDQLGEAPVGKAFRRTIGCLRRAFA